LLRHYRKLAFYALRRFEGDNYAQVRRYFADVFISEVGRFVDLDGMSLVDVGGSRGEFSATLEARRNMRCVNVDIDVQDAVFRRSVVASGGQLPFRGGEFDVYLSRGAIEHVPPVLQQAFLHEAQRVLKPGGVAYVMTQPWYAPHAGHQFRLFHYFPIRIARALKNPFTKQDLSGSTWADAHLYPLTYRRVLSLIQNAGLTYVTGLDTHLKLHFLASHPVLREVGMMSVAFICRKPDVGPPNEPAHSAQGSGATRCTGDGKPVRKSPTARLGRAGRAAMGLRAPQSHFRSHLRPDRVVTLAPSQTVSLRRPACRAR